MKAVGIILYATLALEVLAIAHLVAILYIPLGQ
jgi:hypothetical protein